MSRELDSAVAEAMGWTARIVSGYLSDGDIFVIYDGPNGEIMYADEPWFSLDDAKALQVVKWMRERGWLCRLHIAPDYYWAGFDRWDTTPSQHYDAESKERLSEAICRAFLRATGKGEGSTDGTI